MVRVVHLAMENIVLVCFLAYLLVMVPIIGIKAVHDSARANSPV